MVGAGNIIAFQPEAAIRYGEEHYDNVMDRDNGKIPAVTIRSNNLKDILAIIDEANIDSSEKPIVFVAQIMFRVV